MDYREEVIFCKIRDAPSKSKMYMQLLREDPDVLKEMSTRTVINKVRSLRSGGHIIQEKDIGTNRIYLTVAGELDMMSDAEKERIITALEREASAMERISEVMEITSGYRGPKREFKIIGEQRIEADVGEFAENSESSRTYTAKE